MLNIRQFVNGLRIIPASSLSLDRMGELQVDQSTGKLNYHDGTSISPIVTETSTATLTNKTIDASSNSISSITNSNIAANAAIDASKIANGSVSSIEFQYLDGVTGPIQVQFDTITASAVTALTGDVTGVGPGSTATIISNNVVTNAKLAQMGAHTFKGNNTGSTANVIDLTQAQLTAELNLFSDTLQGVVPASGGGTANFLRADGTFATPPNSGGTVTTIGTIDSQSKSANGLVISGANLVAQTADASFPGMVSTGTQTFAGAKTFSTSIATPILNDNGAGLSINSSSNQNITIAPAGTGRLKINAPEGMDMLQIASPTPPAAGYDSLYFKSNDQLYSMNSAGQERPVGSGGSGGINFITLDTSFQPTNPDNFNFEASLGNWATYNNSSGIIAQFIGSTPSGAINTVSTAKWIGQSFTATLSASVSSVIFNIAHSGSITGNIFCKIYSDTAGNPGTLIGTSDAVPAASIPLSTAGLVTFPFTTQPALTNGNKYYAIMDVTSLTVSPGNGLLVPTNNTDPYSGGNLFITLNSGASWTETVGTDIYFDVQSASSALTLTGGTSTLVMSRTTTVGEVLDGVASLKLVKSATNSQNQGISGTANIPLGYRGQIVSYSFPFKVLSGSLVQGDLAVYIYDITNSQLITPINNDVISTGMVSGSFAMPSNTTQVRFGLNFDSTSAVAVSYSIDDVQFGPQELVMGASITDWSSGLTVSYTGLGTVTNNNIYSRIVGDSLVIRGSATVGTTSATTASILLPTGYTIDSSKLPSNASGTLVGYLEDINTASNPVYSSAIGQMLFYDGSITDRVFMAANSNTNFTKENGSTIFNSGNNFSFEFSIPILGLSSNVVTQNSQIMSIANILANGTRVVGTPPTALGQYRSYLRNAGATTHTEINGAPTDIPSSANGIHIWTASSFGAGDSSNNPSKYEIFIGKNIQYNLQAFQTTGRTGFIEVKPIDVGTTSFGLIQTYDPTTGILSITQNVLGAATLATGINPDSSTSYNDAYFDIAVSQQVIPVQFATYEPVYINETQPNGTDGGTAIGNSVQTRTLNTIINQQPWVTLNGSNQFILDAGTYEIEGSVPGFVVSSLIGFLQNITDSVLTLTGTADYGATTREVTYKSLLRGSFTITKQTTFEIQQICQSTKSSNGLGVGFQIATSYNNIYTEIKLVKKS